MYGPTGLQAFKSSRFENDKFDTFWKISKIFEQVKKAVSFFLTFFEGIEILKTVKTSNNLKNCLFNVVQALMASTKCKKVYV